ncbi:hypothetical protein D3C79_978490 [compost metagenome]
MFGQLVIQIDRSHFFRLIFTAQRLRRQLALQSGDLGHQLLCQKGDLAGAVVVGRRLQLGEVPLHFCQIITQPGAAIGKQRGVKARLRDRRVATRRHLGGQCRDLLF